ncbi:hypothetical protein ANO11243_068400 [Dothideomycetidae sp. 11243]|nr:hypothetical protein ANO11243_068400 [fungal sp. No.11243]
MSHFRKFAGRDAAVHAAVTKAAVVAEENDRSLGSKKLGRAKVDVCMRASQSKWGTLDKGQHSGGLVLLQLRFIQPYGYEIQSADGTIEFPATVASVHPPRMAGRPQISKVNRTVDFKPEGQYAGASVGGMGLSQSREYSEEHRWRFEATPDGDGNGYTKVFWVLKDTQKGSHNGFSRPIDVVTEIRFAENNPAPFQVEVDIHGSLKSKKADLSRHFYRLAHPNREKNAPINPKFTTPPVSLDDMRAQIQKQVEELNRGAAAHEFIDFVSTP